jgi:hypothetical protein
MPHRDIDILDDSRSVDRQRYQIRHLEFWKILNWNLPDDMLAHIWNLECDTLRDQRNRGNHNLPRWVASEDGGHPVFKAAVQLEKLKARKFTGAKPANNKPILSKGEDMKITTEVSLDIIKRNDYGAMLLDLHIRLIGVDGKYLSADIDAEEDLTHPRIVSSTDTLGLTGTDQQAFALAAYSHMVRYFGEGPTGGTIKWARWVEVDLSSWIEQVLYHPAAGRVIRILSAQMLTTSPVAKSFTESLEA